jgi:phage terminase large subunit GpA-like protein
MLYDYDYRLENPGASAFSIKWHGLNAPWKSLYWLATEDYQAKQAEARGDYATARTFTQDQKAEEYTDTAGFRNVDATQLALQSARADYQRGRIPDDCVMAVTAIDVQIDRVYSLTLAATQDLRMFIVDWHEDYFARRDEEPTDEMRHAVLTKVRQRHSDGWRYTTDEDGALLHGDLLGVDVRYETKSVGKWIAKATKVVPIMGEDADKKGTKADREYADGLIQVRERIHPTPNQPRRIWYVRTAHIREITRAAWFLADGDPGSLYLPAGVAEDDPLIRHLTAWRIVTDDEGVATRVPKGKRHDYNDCLCYAWAMLLHRMAQRQRNNGKGRVTGVVGKALA